MSAGDTLKALKSNFDALSPRLQAAARYILDQPREVAVYSMRAAAERAGVHPTSMLRLARELGFEGYEDFRDQFRIWVKSGEQNSWSGRARSVRKHAAEVTLVDSLLRQETQNLASLATPAAYAGLREAALRMQKARRVYVVGFRSLYSVAFYLGYACRMFMRNVSLVSGPGGTSADELRFIGEDDLVVAFTYHPYTSDTIRAVNFALERGAGLVAVTDSVVSPIAREGQTTLVVANETPSLFHSVLPALAVAQSLVALLIAEAPEEGLAQLKATEEQLDSFSVYHL